MRFATSLTLLKFMTGLTFMTGTAWAQAALDESGKPQSTLDPKVAPNTLTADQPEYGVDLRLRHVMIPTGMLELFVDRAAGGASNNGIGVDLVRRRGNVELQLGFEFEHVQPGSGVWINKGDNVAGGDEADYILSSKMAGTSLGWFTVEFTFLNHAKITDKVWFRYGGGAGIGFVTGELQKYDVICNGATNDNPEPGCKPSVIGGTGTDADGVPAKYDLPPVFPVVNAIIGVQIRPTKKSVVNIEGGIRTMPFIGVSAGYFM
jgi:hypothetical protein